MRLGVVTDVPGFLAAHDQALSDEFDTLVAGHLTRLDTREDVVAQRQYARRQDRVRAGPSLGERRRDPPRDRL